MSTEIEALRNENVVLKAQLLFAKEQLAVKDATLSEKDVNIGKLTDKLVRLSESSLDTTFYVERVAGINAANLVRDTLDDFKRKVLQPQRGKKYLPLNVPESGANIRQAYAAFFNDARNSRSRSLKTVLAAENISTDDFIDRCMRVYAQTSAVIHACAQAFRTLHSLDEYLVAIQSVPRILPEEKRCVEILS